MASYVIVSFGAGHVISIVAIKKKQQKYIFVLDPMNSSKRLQGDNLKQLKSLAHRIFS